MRDVIVIGGGAAGLSAAVFTARAGRSTLVLDEGNSVLKWALLNNYLGFPGGIAGGDLRAAGLRQAEQAGAEVLEAQVTGIDRVDGGFRVRTEAGDFEGRTLLLATGMAAGLGEALGVAVEPGREPKMGQVYRVDADGRTSVPGVWAAGVAAGTTSHAIVAAGDGARVAVNLLSEMAGKRHVDHEVPRPARAQG